VQYDFIDGTLALKNCPSQHQGEHVIPILNKLLNEIHFDVIVYTQDWHTHDHISFFENLHLRSHLLAKDSKQADELQLFDTAVFVMDDVTKTKKSRVEQILWPTHCVQHTHGAEIHKDLIVLRPNRTRQVINLLKGYESDIDSYSAFWDNQKIRETMLNAKLKEHNVTQVFIGGIATDVCVYSTALHAAEYGYRTYIIEDACRGVDEKNIHLRLDELLKRNCLVAQSSEVKNLV
jgi:exosome complex component RRP4